MKDAMKRRIRKAESSPESRTLLDRALLGTYSAYRTVVDRLKNSHSHPTSKLYLRARNVKRGLNSKQIKFVNVDNAVIWTLDWIKTFPHSYDVIVGIPRSGLFIANLIAIKLGRPLTTPDMLQQGKFWHSKKVKDAPDVNNIDRLLLVDDSIDTGRSMDQAIDTIRAVNPDVDITRACLIVRDKAKPSVDLYHEVLSPPRMFEWNILHRKLGSHLEHGCLAVDLDGVLCLDPPQGADGDEAAYLEWLPNAKPYLIPAFEIDCIVTCRLEKYRSQTEAWLDAHNVKYKDLIMWDLPSKSERRGRFARHKIESVLRVKPEMVWESNWDQSQSIWRETRIPTLCIDRMTLLS